MTTEGLYSFTIQHGSHLPPVAIDHLKCGQCDRGHAHVMSVTLNVSSCIWIADNHLLNFIRNDSKIYNHVYVGFISF